MPRKDIVYNFDSLDAYIDYACGESEMSDRGRSSREVTRADWHGTSTWAQAVDLARHGWPEGRQRIEALAERMRESVAGSIGDVGRIRPKVGITGSRPHIPNYLAGRPDSMMSYRRQPVSQPIVSVMVNIGALADVGVEQMIQRGAAAAALVDVLEATGRRVELSIVSSVIASRETDPRLEFRVVVKRATDAMNPDVIAFALGHPAMLRRITFSARERQDAATRSFYDITSGSMGSSRSDRRASEYDVYVDAVFRSEQYAERWIVDTLRKQGIEV